MEEIKVEELFALQQKQRIHRDLRKIESTNIVRDDILDDYLAERGLTQMRVDFIDRLSKSAYHCGQLEITEFQTLKGYGLLKGPDPDKLLKFVDFCRQDRYKGLSLKFIPMQKFIPLPRIDWSVVSPETAFKKELKRREKQLRTERERLKLLISQQKRFRCSTCRFPYTCSHKRQVRHRVSQYKKELANL
jgi:hypothetical protein